MDRPASKQFDWLKELKVGDEVVVSARNGKFRAVHVAKVLHVTDTSVGIHIPWNPNPTAMMTVQFNGSSPSAQLKGLRILKATPQRLNFVTKTKTRRAMVQAIDRMIKATLREEQDSGFRSPISIPVGDLEKVWDILSKIEARYLENENFHFYGVGDMD